MRMIFASFPVFPVISQQSRNPGDVGVVCGDSSTIAKPTENFKRIKAEAARITYRTSSHAARCRPEGLCSVLDNYKIMLSSDFHDPAHFTHSPVEMYRQYRLRFRRYRRFDLLGVHIVVRPDIDHYRRCTAIDDSGNCCNKGMGNGDHFISRSDSERSHGEVKRIISASNSHHILDTHKLGQVLFKRP